MIEYPTELKKLLLHRPTPLEKLWGVWPTSTGSMIAKPGYLNGSRAIPSYALIYIEQGAFHFIDSRGNEQLLHKNTMYCLIPGVLHQYYYADSGTPPQASWITFEGKQSHSLLNRIGFSMDRPWLTGWDETRIVPLLREIERVFVDEEHTDRLHFVLLLVRLFDELLVQSRQRGFEDAPSHSWLQYSLEFMNTHYANGILISDVARRAGMTRSHFSRMFTEHVGRSPKEYLQQLRMEKAMEYLKETSFTLTEIALTISYPDAYAFSRAFQQYYGYPPSRVRESC
ncbi:MAG: AraC family transcriptional regulator [Paenibacillus sp.]|jgi:AraC-like DNA-binding protein|nr:AraC family transcriptional regulator [Paenibacillus sp.]